MGNASWIVRDLIHYYELVCSTVYAIYAAINALLKLRYYCIPFFDGLSVMMMMMMMIAAPLRRPQCTDIVGTNESRPNSARMS